MKILFLTTAINENGGGTTSFAIDFIIQYQNEHEIIVISGEEKLTSSQGILNRVNHLQLNPEDLSFENATHFIKLVEEVKPDVIFNNSFLLFAATICFLDKAIIKISISHFVDGKLAIIAGYNHFFYDSIIVGSVAGKVFLHNYYYSSDSEKFKIIFNFFEPQSQCISIEDKAKTQIISIVYPGGSSLHKNPQLVYKILKELQKTEKQFVFYWLGDTLIHGARLFGTHYISDLFTKDSRLVFTGLINREKAVEIIRNANVFLLPSKKEGCPFTLLEAMSAGTIPVVSDAKHASSEIIQNGVNGFVFSGRDEKQYVELICEIVSNHPKYKEIYHKSKETFSSELSLINWKQKIDLILKSRGTKKEKKIINKNKYMFSVVHLKALLIIELIKGLYRSFSASLFFHIRRFIRK